MLPSSPNRHEHDLQIERLISYAKTLGLYERLCHNETEQVTITFTFQPLPEPERPPLWLLSR